MKTLLIQIVFFTILSLIVNMANCNNQLILKNMLRNELGSKSNFTLKKCIDKIFEFENVSNVFYVYHQEMQFQSEYIVQVLYNTAQKNLIGTPRRVEVDFYVIESTQSKFDGILLEFKKTVYFNQKITLLIILLEEQDVSNIFEKLWEIRITNVVVLQGIKVYTYNPISRDGCKQLKPQFLYNCFENPKHYQNDVNVKSFNKCKLNVASIPFGDFSSDTSFYLNKGIGVMMVKEIGKLVDLEVVGFDHSYLSGTILVDGKYVSVLEKAPNGSYLGLAGELLKHNIDVFTFTYSRSKLVEFDVSYPLAFFKVNVYVPKAKPFAVWKNVFKIFSPYVWILITLTFLIMIPFCYFIIRKESEFNLQETIIFLYVTFINSHQWKPEKNLTRSFYIAWIIFTFIIISSYNSLLTSYMFLPGSAKQIETIEELANSELKLLTTADGIYLFNIMGEQFRKIAQRAVHPPLFTKHNVEKFERGETSLFIDPVFSQSELHFKRIINFFQINWSYLSWGVLIFNKNSPFKERFNQLIIRYREHGLTVPFGWINVLFNEDLSNVKQVAVSVDHLIAIFIIYGISMILASVTFVVELLLESNYCCVFYRLSRTRAIT